MRAKWQRWVQGVPSVREPRLAIGALAQGSRRVSGHWRGGFGVTIACAAAFFSCVQRPESTNATRPVEPTQHSQATAPVAAGHDPGVPSRAGSVEPLEAASAEASSLVGVDTAPEATQTTDLADADPDNDLVALPPTPIADCEQKLREAQVQFGATQIPLRRARNGVFTCGTEQAVVYERGPQGLRFNARPRVTCRMALGLAQFERIAQEQARQHLGTTIRRVVQVGTYSCRQMQRFDLVSEHSYANAIDLKAFELADGRKITVLSHFGSTTEEPRSAESRFLRSLAQRLYRENVFSVVLTPFFDRLHRDHFHLDQARYRLDGTGPG